MECACIKKSEFSLIVEGDNCGLIHIQDDSVWSTGGDIRKPEEYTMLLEIQSRNFKKEITIKTDKINTFTSQDLFGTSYNKRLQDDVYCFTVETCGYQLTIDRAYLCNTKKDINDLIAKNAENISSEMLKTLNDLLIKVQAIEINAKRGNINLAHKLLKIVKNKLKVINCDTC